VVVETVSSRVDAGQRIHAVTGEVWVAGVEREGGVVAERGVAAWTQQG
jgi:hypothetical protein